MSRSPRRTDLCKVCNLPVRSSPRPFRVLYPPVKLRPLSLKLSRGDVPETIDCKSSLVGGLVQVVKAGAPVEVVEIVSCLAVRVGRHGASLSRRARTERIAGVATVSQGLHFGRRHCVRDVRGGSTPEGFRTVPDNAPVSLEILLGATVSKSMCHTNKTVEDEAGALPGHSGRQKVVLGMARWPSQPVSSETDADTTHANEARRNMLCTRGVLNDTESITLVPR